MRTVRDFRNLVLAKTDSAPSEEFVDNLDDYVNFWRKLNALGTRNMKKQPPEIVPDVGATVELSDLEWAELETEFDRLQESCNV